MSRGFALTGCVRKKGVLGDFIEVKKTMENDDPVYGDGFRMAYKHYQSMGLMPLLGYVERHGRFPE